MLDKGEGVIPDLVEAAKWFRESADQSFAKAQFNLGLKYDNGQGVTSDHVEPANWYRKAAEQGNPSAQFSLGLKYKLGQGVMNDCVQAYTWLMLAVECRGEDSKLKYTAVRDRVGAFAGMRSPLKKDKAWSKYHNQS
jgi:TPR repeat protein